jgi:hypothetical protein
VKVPPHWAFAEVTDREIARGFVGFESDACELAEDEGYPRVTGADGTPLNFTVLATADFRSDADGGKPAMAIMGEFSKNGTVFNVGSTDWCRGLQGTPPDPNVVQVTRNVMRHLRGRRIWDWDSIGHANGDVMTAASAGCSHRRPTIGCGADFQWVPTYRGATSGTPTM